MRTFRSARIGYSEAILPELQRYLYPTQQSFPRGRWCVTTSDPELVGIHFAAGAFFGTTFAHLFFQSYRELAPAPFWKHASPSSTSPRSSASSSSNQPPFVNPNPYGGQKRAAGKVYIPKIYGFRVSERAKSGPRMQWMRSRPENAEELDLVDWRGRWIDDDDHYDDDEEHVDEDRPMEDFDPVTVFFYIILGHTLRASLGCARRRRRRGRGGGGGGGWGFSHQGSYCVAHHCRPFRRVIHTNSSSIVTDIHWATTNPPRRLYDEWEGRHRFSAVKREAASRPPVGTERLGHQSAGLLMECSLNYCTLVLRLISCVCDPW